MYRTSRKVRPCIRTTVNEADEKALTQLPGIGPAMAAAIVAYRDEHGAFSSVDELKQVKGIGTNKYEKLKDCVDL